ncbi:MAG: ABC transporter permease subunit [Oscillospiraceae bacterium]|nr:ABC transporter permease subunit [Oscillospiraceae bacterium]
MSTKSAVSKENSASLFTRIRRNKEIYFLLVFGLIWYIVFAYIPMYGLTLAFKTYKASLGIFGSPWTGLENYVYVFKDPAFLNSVIRTLQINVGRLVFQFPFPIILALMINELRVGRFKKVLQSVYTFPHFLSWIIVASILTNVLGQTGLVNSFVRLVGGTPISFLGTPAYFQPLIYITEIWKSAGWSAIIYMAAISGIDQEQYEAAEIDGASRFQRIRYITFPGIQNTITVMFILAVGNIMNAGFDQIFNISNPATSKVAETLDMYIYRVTFKSASDFSFSSAVSLFKSVINFTFLLAADRVSKLFGGEGLFG